MPNVAFGTRAERETRARDRISQGRDCDVKLPGTTRSSLLLVRLAINLVSGRRPPEDS